MLHDFGKQALGQYMLGVATVPATLYVALLTSFPASSVDGTGLSGYEPAVVDYARKAYTTAGGWTVDALGNATNFNAVVYTTATVLWPMVYGYALCTALSGGSVLLSQQFNVSGAQQCQIGSTFRIPVGGITFVVSNP